MITTSSFISSNFSATAFALIIAAIKIFFADKDLVSVFVPLVVVIRTLFPPTSSLVYSKGEFETSKPSIFTAFLSPPKIQFSLLSSSAFSKVSSIVKKGITSLHPLFKAVTITEVALNISITIAILFSILPSLISSPLIIISTFIVIKSSLPYIMYF